MAEILSNITKEEGNVTGKIVSEDPIDSGETAKGNPWNDWDVELDDGRKAVLRTFGDRANKQAQEIVGENAQFYNNNGFCNFKKLKGSAVKTVPKSAVSKSKQESIEEMHEHKVRGIALSYAKDMCTAGIIKKEDVLPWADKFIQYLLSLPQSTEGASDDEWMDKGSSEDLYPDGRPYGCEPDMLATEVQAEELLATLRIKCKDGDGKPNISMAVDVLNGLLCKFYYNDLDPSIETQGEITGKKLKHAIMDLDALTVQWCIAELSK